MLKNFAVITGASSGIGRAVAREIASACKGQMLCGRNESRLAKVVAGIQFAESFVGDLTNLTTRSELLHTLELQDNAPDLVVLSAGIGLPGTVLTSDSSQWELLVQTNVTSQLHLLRMFANLMLSNKPAEQSKDKCMDIVVIGSSIGTNVSPFNSVYGATKFALHGAVEGLRRDLGPEGIRVSLVEPGIVASEFQEHSGYDLDWFNEYQSQIGPVLKPNDIARLVRFIVEQPAHVNINDVMIRPVRQTYP